MSSLTHVISLGVSLLALGTYAVSPSYNVLRADAATLRTRDLLLGRQSVCNSGYYYCSGTGFYACCPNFSDICWQNSNTNSVDCGDWSDYSDYLGEDNTSSSSDPAGSDTSDSTTSSSSSSRKKKGLKGGAIGGIVVAIIFIIAAIAGGAFRYWKKKKNAQPSFNPASPGDNFNNVQPYDPNAPTSHGPVEYNNGGEKAPAASNATEIPPSPYQPVATPAPYQQAPYQPPVSPVQSVAQPQVYQAPQSPPVYYPPPAQQPVQQHNIPNIPQLQ